MDKYTMVVAIVAITVTFGFLFDVYKKHMQYKEKQLNNEKASSNENQALQAKVVKLESRIEVLERIVTDEGYQVKKEINNL